MYQQFRLLSEITFNIFNVQSSKKWFQESEHFMSKFYN